MDFEKFKSLAFNKKVGWLIHYYGVAAIIAIIVIAVIVFFIKSVLMPEPMRDVCIIALSDNLSQDDAYAITQEIEKIISGTVDVTVYGTSEPYGRASFSMKINADQIDLVLAPYEETMEMIDTEYLTNYEKIENTNLYLGLPAKARQGEKLDKCVEYFRTYFIND